MNGERKMRLKGGEYVTATEAATIAGIARDTFTSYVSRGQGNPPKPVEIGGRKMYRLADVKKWADNRTGRGARTDLKPKRKPVR